MLRLSRASSLVAACLVLPLALNAQARRAHAERERASSSAAAGWSNYGRDGGDTRFSPLAQITPQNVGKLGIAWIYDTGQVDRNFESTPLVIGNVLYVTTPVEKVVALEADTGRTLWVFDPHEERVRVSRGLSYWPGDAQHAGRLLMATSGDGRIIELDPRTGRPITSFGRDGSVKVSDTLAARYHNSRYGFTSPPAVYKNLIIVSPDLQEGPSHGAPGTVSAFDALTGQLVWQFYLTPRPGQVGAGSWGPQGWQDRSGPAAWAPITVDATRGLVYVPVANPADSYYGADRPGNDLFSDSVVALDAATGKLSWYFQLVHHDLFDDDTIGTTLVDAGPERTPALIAMTKAAIPFILNRENGKPVFAVREVPVPVSTVPGEHPSPTQPFPIKPPPLAIQAASATDVTTVTPASHRACVALFAKFKNEGAYSPFQLTPSLHFPSTVGGANWGGFSYDPGLDYIFVNTSNLGSEGQMLPAGKTPPGLHRRFPARDPDRVVPPPAQAGGGAGARPAPREVMPYHNPYVGVRFVDERGYPCQQPPWGLLTAINARTGEIAWQHPLGEYAELTAQGVAPTGTPTIGGSVVTASGLLFIAATVDGKLRAFDDRTGQELWQASLGGYGISTPMTYRAANGKQYVAIAVGGAGSLSGVHQDGVSGDVPDRLVVFAVGAKGTLPTSSAASPAGAAPAAPPSPLITEASQLPPGPGRDLVAEQCAMCHGLQTVTAVRLDKAAWEAMVNQMVGRGAKLTEAQVDLVAGYMATHFGSR